MVKKNAVIIAAALSLLVLSSCGNPLSVVRISPAVKQYGKATLTEVNGCRILKLYGSPYQMGYQYGALVKDDVRKYAVEIGKLAQDQLKDLPWWQKSFSDLYLVWNADDYFNRVSQEYRDEVQGLSDGAGISKDLILQSSWMFGISCTSLVRKLPDGRLLFGKNLDWWPQELGAYPVIVEYHPDDGQSYILVSVLGYTGALTGINESGIYGTYNVLQCYENFPDTANDIPVVYKLRRILEKARTLSDVDAALAGYPRGGGMMTIGSAAEKGAAVYELYLGDWEKVLPNGDGYLYALNRFISPGMRKRHGTFYGDFSTYNGYRSLQIESRIGAAGIANADDMISALSDVSLPGKGDVIGVIDETVNNSATIQSIVIDPQAKDIYFASGLHNAGLGAFFKYNYETGEVAQYREASVDLSGSYMKWRDEIGAALKKSDVRKVLDLTPLDDAEPDQLGTVWSIYRNQGKYGLSGMRLEDLLPQCDRLLTKYPWFWSLYYEKADILESLGRSPEARDLLKSALLDSNVLVFEFDRFYALYALLKTYYESGDKASFVQLYPMFTALHDSASSTVPMTDATAKIQDVETWHTALH